MSSAFLVRIVSVIQWTAFTLLLIFAPLARGGTSRWALGLSLWLMLLAFTAMILRRMWLGMRVLPRSGLGIPLTLLLLIAGASWFVSIYRGATTWALLRLVLYVGAFYLAVEATESRSRTRWLVITILGMGTLLSFIGFIKYLGGTVPAYWVFAETGEHRLTSTFVTPNYLAGYLEMVFLVGLGYILCRPSKNLLIWTSCLFLILMSILLSMSRGALLATFAALIFMGILFFQAKEVSKIKVLLASSALVLTITLTFLGSSSMIKRWDFQDNPEGSYVTRLAVWKGSIQLIKKNPVLGTGLGTFPWSFPAVRPAGLEWRYLEAINDYIQLATETGIISLLPIMWGIYLIFKAGIKKFKQTNSRFRAGVTLGALCGVTAMLVHSILDYNIQITSNGILFSVLVGLVIGSSTSKESSRQSKDIQRIS